MTHDVCRYGAELLCPAGHVARSSVEVRRGRVVAHLARCATCGTSQRVEIANGRRVAKDGGLAP